MSSAILTRQSLPEALLRLIHTEKVYLQEKDGEIRISPLCEGSGLLGIGENCNLNTERLLLYKREEAVIENRATAQ